jgi:hypothetical protein
MILNGRYDGRGIVLDQPVPPGIAPDTPVKVRFEENPMRNVLDRIAELAGPADLPPDFSKTYKRQGKGDPNR